MIPRYEDPEYFKQLKPWSALTAVSISERESDLLAAAWGVFNLSTLANLRKIVAQHGTAAPQMPTWVEPWAASNFPVVTLSEVLAAELACTALPADVSEIRSPWPAWFIVNDFDRTEVISVQQDAACWKLECLQHADAAAWADRALNGPKARALNTCAPSSYGVTEYVFRAPPRRILDPRTRAVSLMCGLVGNLCLAVSVGQVRLKAVGPKLPKRDLPAAPPTLRAQADVTIDLRPVLRAYIAGETGPRWRLTVRSYVRGFWRRPPGGALDVKTVWVRPHWRGPRDGVLADRMHRVVASEKLLQSE